MPPAWRADLAGRIRNQLRARAFEAEEAYWTASEAFIAARVARAAAIAAQRLARLQASIRLKLIKPKAYILHHTRLALGVWKVPDLRIRCNPLQVVGEMWS